MESNLLTSCPFCGANYRLEQKLEGRKVACSKCKKNFSAHEGIGRAIAKTTNQEMPSLSLDSSRYKVISEIERGGMGVILRSSDRDINRDVAMKVMLGSNSQRARERFISEAQITGQLEHPNIVPVHETGIDDDNNLYFTMKLVKGKSLKEILKSRAKKEHYSLTQLLDIFKSICNGIAFAHTHKVIHRDLKPANIMVGAFGEVLVMDWGIAKVIDAEVDLNDQELSEQIAEIEVAAEDGTQQGQIVGTAAYMPPEQAKGDIDLIDARSDIYSLGAILYEILTLTPPITVKGTRNRLLAVSRGEIEDPIQRAPERDIPPELAAITMKAMALEQDERYQSVNTLKKDIDLYLEGHAVSAREDSWRESLHKLYKRNKVLVIAAAVTAVATILGLGTSLYSLNNASNALAKAEQETLRATAAEQVAKTESQKAQDALAVAKQEKLRAQEQQLRAEAALKKADLSAALALEQQQKAETNYQKFKKQQEQFLQEQERRQAEALASAPAYFERAKKMVSQREFDLALAEVARALDANSDYHEARMLKIQILASSQSYPAALAELTTYLAANPDDKHAQRLQEICNASDEHSREDISQMLSDTFSAQGAFAFASLTNVPWERKVEIWRGRIENSWAGLGEQLSSTGEGNLDFNGSRTTVIKDLSALSSLPLTSLNLANTPISDLSPLKGMQLQSLDISHTHIDDLTALQGMPLRQLTLAKSRVRDLSPLADAQLRILDLSGLAIDDFSPIKNQPIVNLGLSGSSLTSIAELNKLPLLALDLSYTNFTDLKQLRSFKKLRELNISGNFGINDLSSLRGVKLKKLYMAHTGVRDVAAIKRSGITELSFTPENIGSAANDIKKILSLRQLGVSDSGENMLPKKLFWQKLKESSLGITPAELNLELAKVNPGYSGGGEFSLEKGNVVAAEFPPTIHLVNIKPLARARIKRLIIKSYLPIESGLDILAALPLEQLRLNNANSLRDLKPLLGKKINYLSLSKLDSLTTLENIEKLPLTRLSLSGLTKLPQEEFDRLRRLRNLTSIYLGYATQLEDISFARRLNSLRALYINYAPALKQLPALPTGLISLSIEYSNIADISGLQKLSQLSYLDLSGCPIEDLRPLAPLPLERLHINLIPTDIEGFEIVQQLPLDENPWALIFRSSIPAKRRVKIARRSKSWKESSYLAMYYRRQGETAAAKQEYQRLLNNRKVPTRAKELIREQLESLPE